MSRRKRNSVVRRAFRREGLARLCTLPEEEFADAYGMETVEVSATGPGRFYAFKDNGSRILAVAHLDTVVRPADRAAQFFDTKAGPLVVSGALDDRLGAYIVLDLLPELGISCDTLLTTGEESGQSTAEHFKPGKDYDWMIEFDRGGTDVVMYQYEDHDTREAVKASGAVVGPGIFSDICYLDHLGVKGFNWGVGYRDYHSPRGHAYLNETYAMVERFRRFHAQNAGTAMPHAVDKADDYWYLGYRSTADPDPLACPFCAGTVDWDTGYCDDCTRCIDCRDLRDDCSCYQPRAGVA